MAFPATIDNFTDPTAADNLDSAPVLHDVQHKNLNDAIFAIETELGLNPRGTAISVKARLDAIDAAITAKANSSLLGAANGVATLDVGSQLVQNVDAAKLTSGLVPVARIPNLSGAKILGTGSGGAAIPVDAVPNLPASKTNSGQFATAQIPDLDAVKITSGVFAAARIPGTVTANANATVVADIAARDAIPIGNRINGQLVFIESTKQLFEWSTNSSTWNLVSAAVDVSVDITSWMNAGFVSYSASYPFRGWYNTATKRFNLEMVVTRSSNSASLSIHSIGTVPVAYRSDKYSNCSIQTNVGGTEATRRITITMGGTNSIDLVLPAAAIWSLSTQYAMVTATWVVA